MLNPEETKHKKQIKNKPGNESLKYCEIESGIITEITEVRKIGYITSFTKRAIG